MTTPSGRRLQRYRQRSPVQRRRRHHLPDRRRRQGRQHRGPSVCIPKGSTANDDFGKPYRVGGASVPAWLRLEPLRDQAGRASPTTLARPAAPRSGSSGRRRSSAEVSIDTCGSGFDTLLGVYTGSAVDALDAGRRATTTARRAMRAAEQARPSTPIANTTYRIAVDGKGGARARSDCARRAPAPTTTSPTPRRSPAASIGWYWSQAPPDSPPSRPASPTTPATPAATRSGTRGPRRKSEPVARRSCADGFDRCSPSTRARRRCPDPGPRESTPRRRTVRLGQSSRSSTPSPAPPTGSPSTVPVATPATSNSQSNRSSPSPPKLGRSFPRRAWPVAKAIRVRLQCPASGSAQAKAQAGEMQARLRREDRPRQTECVKKKHHSRHQR